MSLSFLESYSNALADAVERVAPAVVQIHGRRRPVTGLVVGENLVLTTGRVLGRDDGVTVRTADGRSFQTEAGGWDPATGLAIIHVPELGIQPAEPSTGDVRPGQVVIAVGRSWSNAVTASPGHVAIVGGPLRTGRRRSIEQVIRITAPLHDGFAGGPVIDASGRVAGVATGAAIRGFEVIVPAAIAWRASEAARQRGRAERGYLGLGGQSVTLPERQRTAAGAERALLVVGVAAGSPAETAGVLVGDLVVAFGGTAITSADDLLELLAHHGAGTEVPMTVVRGGARLDVAVTVGARP